MIPVQNNHSYSINQMQKNLMILAGLEDAADDNEKSKDGLPLRDTEFYKFNEAQEDKTSLTSKLNLFGGWQHGQSLSLTASNGHQRPSLQHQSGTTSTSDRNDGREVPPPSSSTRLTRVGFNRTNVPNIHTGATPPWLLGDGDDGGGVDGGSQASIQYGSVGGLIGPSLPLNIERLAKDAKNKEKNPKRLRNTQAPLSTSNPSKRTKQSSATDEGDGGDGDETWLPSFGGVWQSATRSRFQSKLDFVHRQKQ